MYKQIFFLFIVLIHVLVFTWQSLLKKRTHFLLVSLFVICIPFQISYYFASPDFNTPSGTFGNTIYVPFAFLLFLVIAVFNITKIKRTEIGFRFSNWVTIIYLMILVSLLNPFNISPFATVIFLVFFTSHILLFKLIYSINTAAEVIKGLYIGLAVLTAINFVSAILFPLLNFDQVTTFFDPTGLEGATRLGTRSGAVGTYNHPNTLGVFVGMNSAFFLSCWLKKYLKKISLGFLACSSITLVLTFSRTSYLVFIVMTFLLVFIHLKPARPIFSVENVLKLILPVGLVLSWIVFFSPFTYLFTGSDVSQQVDNRELHWAMAVEAFHFSPFIGVGLNTHLEFFSAHYYLINFLGADEFFLENHIHNIHLIILAEAGGIGLLLWLLFLITNIAKAKKEQVLKNDILSLTQIGVILIYILNGITDWAPFSGGILPLFLFINFFAVKHRQLNETQGKINEITLHKVKYS